MGNLRGLSGDDDRAAQRVLLLTGATGWLFASGHAADLILAVMAVEGVWLVRGAHWPPAAAASRLLPGALLVLALRAALIGAAPWWVALALGCSLPAHVADLVLGAPRRRRTGGAR